MNFTFQHKTNLFVLAGWAALAAVACNETGFRGTNDKQASPTAPAFQDQNPVPGTPGADPLTPGTTP